MKRFTKFVGLLLCLAMVLSIVPATVVGAASTTENGSATGYKIVNNTTLTGKAGYINASGTFVETAEEGECLVEGAYGRCAYLNENINGEIAAIAEVDLSATKKIGAVEITGDRNTQLDPTDFEIQAWVNGAWTTVKSVTGAFTSGARSQRYTFDAVDTNKIRLYITRHEGAYCSIGEIELYEAVSAATPSKIDLTGSNASANCSVSSAATLTSAVVGSVCDGDKSTIVTFSSNTPTITFNLTKNGQPTNVSAFSLFGNRSGNRPTSVEVKVQTTAGGSYVSVGTYNFSANNRTSYPFQPYYTELGASYDAYGVQLVVKSLNYAETAGCALAEIELYGGTVGSGTVIQPDEPEVDIGTGFAAPVPVVGYYTDNNTNGAITNHAHGTHSPANMVDGDTTNQSRSGYYTHAEIASGAKVPVILFDFEKAVTLEGIEIFGYEAKRYNMEDFDIQVNVDGAWKTVETVTDAFRDQGEFGDTLKSSLKIQFEETYKTTALRILVKGISDMTPDADEDAEMANGGYIRVREIKLYGTAAAGEPLDTAKVNGVDIGDYVIVYSDTEPDYNYTAAQYIQEQIAKRTGRTIEIVEDDAAEAANEILVGHTNRALSAILTAPANMQMKFSIQASGTKIAMEADYFIIAGAAYYFVDTFIGTSNFDNTVPAQKQELEPITEKANNYIFLIGDGMGVMQTKFFDKFGASPTTGDYGYGDGEDVFYGYYLPYQGWSQTANVFGTITDSAAGGTALATGYKTINGYVGKDKSLKDIKNLSEVAWDLGKAVGIMSTEGSDGATPASFSAHSSGRYDNEIITDQDAMEAQGYVFVERYRSSADAYNAVFKAFTAEEYERWDTKVKAGMSKLTQNPNGFFLMYEEAYIDKNCHNDDQLNAYRTVYRFNQQIAYFMEFAMYNPDTLVLITADHETSGLTEDFVATQFNLPPETGCDHSLQDVPVFVYGQGGEIYDGVTTTNASIGRTFAHLMTDGNADDFGNPMYPIIGQEPGEDITAPDGDVPEAPSTPVVQGNVLQIVSPTRLTTKFGVYRSGDPSGVFSDGGDGYCVTDGWYIRSGYSEHNKADGLTALLIDLDKATTLGGFEISGHTAAGSDPTKFDVQAYVDGAWVTVVSVTSNPYANGPRTVKYTFDAVTTSKIRVLIHDYEGSADCKIGEVSLFEVTTGNVSNKVEILDKTTNLTDGDKSTCFTGESAVINLTVDGMPTAISAVALYHARANNTAFPGSFTISIQRTSSGIFEPVAQIVTNWENKYPLDSVFADLGQTYMAYALQITFDKRAAATELELFQHVHEEAPELDWTAFYEVEEQISNLDMSKYTEDSVSAFDEVKIEANDRLLNPNLTQDELDAITAMLVNAMNKLERIEDLVITKQPTTQKVAVSKTAKFTVTATGTGLTYQWQSSADGKTWKNCSSSSATSATFKFTSKTSHNGNYYRCVITDAANNVVYTDTVRLYVLGVTTQPTAQKVAVSKTVKFTVKATGDGLKYQWQSSADGKTWKNCSSSSATKATFSFTSKTSHNGNYYRCKVTDSKGNVVYSDTVRLYVLGVTTQPKTQKVAVSKTVKFTVKATGDGLKYQWQSSADGKTWKNCSSSSATKATFSFTSKTSHNGNYYRCKVTDSKGNVVYTDAVRLHVLGITEQPVAKTVAKGKTVKFAVEATGSGLKYQWQSSADGKTWKDCSSSSATKATFSFTSKASHNGNYYRCVVTDSAGNVVYTVKVKLTVK